MSDNTSSSGLLSRMAKFVKNSATGWAELEQLDSSKPGAPGTRQALKDMIDRKRRNDASRREEFAMLRRIRRGEVAKDADQKAGPSSYVSSLPADAARPQRAHAHTLEKKIDQIEEQMAQSWFKKPRSDAAAAPQPRPHPQPSPARHPAQSPEQENPTFEPTVPMSRLPELAAERQQQQRPQQQQARPAIQEHPAVLDAPEVAGAHTPVRKPELADDDPDAYTFGVVGDFNVEVSSEITQDAELEESAIRFANGDAAGAEESLLELTREGGSRQNHEDTWLCLFDLYRATAQQAKFEEAAIEFANRFGRSAPQWGLLTPDQLTQMTAHAHAGKNARATLAQWAAPATLSAQSMTALAAALKRSTPPWRIDWRSVKNIHADALPALCEQLSRWADSGDRVKFLGVEALQNVLAEKTPNEDRNTDAQWWTARLALLRLMGEMDEFDLVALNYCVTYEVSPPAWQAPRCHYTAMTPEGETVLAETDTQEKTSDTRSPAEEARVIDGFFKTQLSGEILDDPMPLLAPVREQVAAANFIEINCRQVLRVDFAAAGMLLNWATELHAQKKKVAFTHLNRLVALFFGVVGIQEVARVAPRQD